MTHRKVTILKDSYADITEDCFCFYQVASNPLNTESLCNGNENPETSKMAFQALTRAIDPLALTLSDIESTIPDDDHTWTSSDHCFLQTGRGFTTPRHQGGEPHRI